jgi:hypothetical protein
MSKSSGTDWRQVAILIGMFLIILVLWNTIVVYPIKLFVVLLHELSHGIAAIITGGSMHMIAISPLQGGATWSSGGLRLIVLPAGYIGSMLLGGLILVAAARTRADKSISVAIGLIVVLITILYIRNVFGFVFGFIFGALMIVLGIFAPRVINDYILKFIGLTSILYAVLDIKDDLIMRTVRGSDAYQMSTIIPLPPIVWGILWIIIDIVVAFIFLKIATQKPEVKNGNF